MEIARIYCQLNSLQWAILENEASDQANEAIRYQGCGLHNVYLLNGYRYGTLTSGEQVLYVADIPGLHRAISADIAENFAELDAKTFKFLRKEQDMSQRQLADILGIDEKTVSNWEDAKTHIPTSAALLLLDLTMNRCAVAKASPDARYPLRPPWHQQHCQATSGR